MCPSIRGNPTLEIDLHCFNGPAVYAVQPEQSGAVYGDWGQFGNIIIFQPARPLTWPTPLVLLIPSRFRLRRDGSGRCRRTPGSSPSASPPPLLPPFSWRRATLAARPLGWSRLNAESIDSCLIRFRNLKFDLRAYPHTTFWKWCFSLRILKILWLVQVLPSTMQSHSPACVTEHLINF